jgi:hypothetical protein
VTGFVNWPVRETLALDTLEGSCRTFPICHFAGVPLEIPFREVARQMGFADRMMPAEYGAFHKAETALGSIGMHEATKLRKLICRVVHGAVIGKLLSYVFVGRQFVSHQMRFAADCRDDLFAKGFGFDIGDME